MRFEIRPFLETNHGLTPKIQKTEMKIFNISVSQQ